MPYASAIGMNIEGIVAAGPAIACKPIIIIIVDYIIFDD